MFVDLLLFAFILLLLYYYYFILFLCNILFKILIAKNKNKLIFHLHNVCALTVWGIKKTKEKTKGQIQLLFCFFCFLLLLVWMALTIKIYSTKDKFEAWYIKKQNRYSLIFCFLSLFIIVPKNHKKTYVNDRYWIPEKFYF